MSVKVAENEAASVHVDDNRSGWTLSFLASKRFVGRIVEAYCHGAMRAGELFIEGELHDRAAFYPELTAEHVVLTHDIESDRGVIRITGEGGLFREDRLHLRIDASQYIKLVHEFLLLWVGCLRWEGTPLDGRLSRDSGEFVR